MAVNIYIFYNQDHVWYVYIIIVLFHKLESLVLSLYILQLKFIWGKMIQEMKVFALGIYK